MTAPTHVMVLGAGIVGVCTAWYLRRQGFEVTVLERREAVAQETSWGNAGVIAPGAVTPWAAPGMPRKVLSYLLKSESPVLLRPSLDPGLWRWITRWLRECTLERYRRNKSRMQRIALYSRTQLHALREELGLSYEARQGYLQLLRTEREIELTAPGRALLAENGVPHQLLSPDECRALEPGLSQSTPLAAALYLPEDESGSCPRFAEGLAQAAQAQGVAFEFGIQALGLRTEGGRFTGVMTSKGMRTADALVVCAAIDSVGILAELGIRIPLWPVKGYSATLPLADPASGPQHAMIDEAYKTAITPFGSTLRIAGTAELGNHALTLRDGPVRTLLKVARDWFPHAARFEQARLWVGARPMTPDGPPLLGASPVKNLYVNVGHGSTGWAMACGSARVVADLIAGRNPEISLEGLTLERLGQPGP